MKMQDNMKAFRPEQACWYLDIYSLIVPLQVNPTYPNMHSKEGRETPYAGQTHSFEVY